MPVVANVELEKVACVAVVAETTCKIRKAPRKLFIWDAVKTAPATKDAGSSVGVAIALVYLSRS